MLDYQEMLSVINRNRMEFNLMPPPPPQAIRNILISPEIGEAMGLPAFLDNMETLRHHIRMHDVEEDDHCRLVSIAEGNRASFYCASHHVMLTMTVPDPETMEVD